MCSQVLEIVSAIRGQDPRELAEIVYENTRKVFFSSFT
jgi:Tat protein secretion system quality control protein TatD with DNase activity